MPVLHLARDEVGSDDVQTIPCGACESAAAEQWACHEVSAANGLGTREASSVAARAAMPHARLRRSVNTPNTAITARPPRMPTNATMAGGNDEGLRTIFSPEISRSTNCDTDFMPSR